MNSIRILLTKLIDYAGLFPPAGLAMAPAVSNYVAYRNGEYAWALGRFVLPVSRLSEFERIAKNNLQSAIRNRLCRGA